MNQEIQELEERFNELVEIKTDEDFFLGFCEFLRFISDTPSLKRQANKLLKGTGTSTAISAVGALYSDLNSRWDNDYNAAEKIWSDLTKKMAGLPTTCSTPLTFSNIKSARPIVRTFNLKLFEELNSKSTSPYRKVALVVDKTEYSICLAEDNESCYSIQNKSKDKSKAPKRFRLITTLRSQKGAVSIARLNLLLGSEKDTQNLKTDIRDVNRLFRKNVYDTDLIVMGKRGNKNMYSLNQETFFFRDV